MSTVNQGPGSTMINSARVLSVYMGRAPLMLSITEAKATLILTSQLKLELLKLHVSYHCIITQPQFKTKTISCFSVEKYCHLLMSIAILPLPSHPHTPTTLCQVIMLLYKPRHKQSGVVRTTADVIITFTSVVVSTVVSGSSSVGSANYQQLVRYREFSIIGGERGSDNICQ